MPLKDFNYLTFNLPDDYEGKVKGTFISASTNTFKRPVILYIHGFIDYFFHPHLSSFFDDNGYDFCAVELRKHGHSILPHQHPNYCKDVSEYYAEIDWALLKIRDLNKEEIVILGHSTGGLIASAYLNNGSHRNMVDALILNSPFLEVNEPTWKRMILKLVSRWVSAIRPYAKLDGMLSELYPKSLHKDYNGEWDFDLTFKPIEGFPVYFAWSNAIMKAQDELKKNASIKQPILLMHSHDSYSPKHNDSRVKKSDIILDVAHMKKYGPGLGKNVTMMEIQGGLHDLFLSPQPVRGIAMDKMMSWLGDTV